MYVGLVSWTGGLEIYSLALRLLRNFSVRFKSIDGPNMNLKPHLFNRVCLTGAI